MEKGDDAGIGRWRKVVTLGVGRWRKVMMQG